MRVPRPLRLSRHMCAAPLFVLAVFALVGNRGDRVAAQEPPPAAMRWDGLIEQVSAPPPFSWSSLQPVAPSQLPRHSVSADGRFVMFAASYLDGSGQGIFLHDRDTGDNTLVLGAWATHPALSADGHQLAFEECGWNREDGPPYYCDVVVLDVRTGAIHRVSETADGIPGDGDSSHPVLSADGRFVAFRTNATNLAGPGAVSGQIVVRDRDVDGNGVFDEPGTTTIDVVSAESGSSAPADGESDSAELSDDGRYVAFRSRATNLLIARSTAEWNVFLRDRLTHATRQLNVKPDGQPSPFSVDTSDISITADGRYVAFASADPLLAAGYPDDTDAALDVFVYDRDTSSLTRIDLTSDGLSGSADVQSPMFSADGRYVAVVAMSRNDSNPPAPFSTLVHVYDRATATSTLVSVRPDGIAPDDRADHAVLSADASIVLFVSAATNLAPNVTARLDNVYAAVHFAVEPSEVTVPARGGTGTFTITAQAHTHWYVGAAEWPNWFTIETAPQGVGNGTLVASAWQPNYDPTSRSTTLTANDAKTLRLTQEPGLWLTSVAPDSGPATGGTVVTLHGTGFEPDTRVMFSNSDATNVQFVDSTTMIATAPPGLVGPAFVGVISSDFRTSWLGEAFRYLDTTPPNVFPGLSGIVGGDGWFTSDVDLYWGAWDPDTPVTSWSGCDTVHLTTDTPGTTFTCTATSEGGAASASATIKRDATPPAITITSPSPSQPIYERNQVAAAAYQCADALSGVASCSGDVPPGEPIDTSWPGYHPFTAWGADRAGNVGGVWTEYAVSNGFCTAANPGLKAWWRMADDTREAITGATPLRVDIAQDAFAPAITGQGYVFPNRSTGRLDHYHYSALDFTTTMTFAGWVKPTDAGWGVLVRHPFQYMIQRFGDGSIGFEFAQQDGGVAQATTSAKSPQDVWTHVAVTYDIGFVKTYINGRLVDTYRRSGTLRVPGWQTPLSIGGQDDPSNPKPFVGSLDELQLFDRVLSDGDIESMFLAGSDGTCEPRATAIELSPIQATYGAGTYHVTATLRDDSGQPLPDESMTLYQEASNQAGDPIPTVTLTTDANGVVTWDAPFAVGAGSYSDALLTVFEGTGSYAHSTARADVVVGQAPVQINWPVPSPITYGTALSYAGQLNATAGVPGSFGYNPASGAVLSAGAHMLNATFHPGDATNYSDSASQVTLQVNQAIPNLTVVGGTFAFDGQPHGATASATDYRGVALSPVTITYNGSPDAPVAAGSYTVVAAFAGDVNHTARSVSTTLTIQQATATIVFSTPATFTYDAQPHGITAAVYGLGGRLVGSAPVSYAGLTGAPVNAGTYTATATFDGGANYEARTVSSTVTIIPASPAVSVSGGTFTFDGHPHPAIATAIGVAGDALVPVTVEYSLAGGGSVPAPVNAGTYVVTASYAGSANYVAASGSGTVTIGRAAPMITWSAPSPIVYGTPLSAAQLNASASVAGSFAYSPGFNTVLAAGSGRALSATFTPSDTQNYTSANAAATIDVARAPLTVRTLDTAKPFGAALPPFTAGGSGFVNGDSVASLSGTVAFSTPATAASPVGTYAVTPSGVTSGNYSIAFAAGALTISPATTSVAVTSSANPSGFNQAVSFSASVAVVAGAGNPTGTIEFRDGSTRLGTVTLASGSAALSTNGLSAGSHSISAMYSGDPSFAASTQSMTHVVNSSAASSATAVTSSSNPAATGASLTLTATVKASAGATGNVAFYDGASLLGTVLLSGTTARLSTTALANGAHAITARYLGDGSVPPSISPMFVQDVAPAGTRLKTSSITLVASPSAATLDGPVTFTATVTGANKLLPTGAILFTVNGQVIGSTTGVTLTATGSVTARATFTTSALAHGTHTVTATYLGDPTYRGVASTISLTVN
jgi:concanavalin A-like lectin/glucanase superfamily protein/Big-like domain-containing protein/MBG domain-containing protein/IPT/TIG domain-containing protein